MVSRLWALAASMLLATPAQAGLDWRMAGGDIFAGPVPEPAAPDLAGGARLPPSAQPFDVAVSEAANRHGIDPKLLHALVAVESAYRPRALSPAGAAGLTQLMPGTAAEVGVADRFDSAASLAGGADYLARQILRFGDLRLALAAYNAGPERVARLGRPPANAETQRYVRAVLACYLALAAGRTVISSQDCRGAPDE